MVGAGNVGLEKLQAIMNNAPATSVTVVAGEISEEVKKLAGDHSNILLIERSFEPSDLDNKDIIIVAVSDSSVSGYVRVLAKQKKTIGKRCR